MKDNLVKIIILDSGIDSSHPIFKDISITQYKSVVKCAEPYSHPRLPQAVKRKFLKLTHYL